MTTTTISRVIPLVDDDGLMTMIPLDAWDELRTIAENEFDAEISIHLHPVEGEYHDQPFVPFGHYLVEATLEEELVEQFTARADLVIASLIERHTLQVPVAVGE